MLIKLQLFISNLVDDIKSREEGQAMVEYALILGLIVLVSITGFTVFGQAVLGLFESAKALMP
jgi:Flp pilus assembly pilin Flp